MEILAALLEKSEALVALLKLMTKFLTLAIFFFVAWGTCFAMPYFWKRDIAQPSQERLAKGLGIAKFLALALVSSYALLYMMFLIGPLPGVSGMNATPLYLGLVFISGGSIISVFVLFQYTIAHTVNVYKEGTSKWLFMLAQAIMAPVVIWVALSMGHYLLTLGLMLNAGKTLYIFQEYELLIWSWRTVTPAMTVLLAWVIVAFMLNAARGEKKETPA